MYVYTLCSALSSSTQYTCKFQPKERRKVFTPLALGTNHMLGVDQFVPLTTQNFELRLFNMDGSAMSANSDLLTLSTDSIGAIEENQDIITVHYGNGIIKFPSKVSFNDVTWTLNCYCSPNVLGALREWRSQVYDAKTEKIGLPSQYMKLCYIVRYDAQGNERDVLKMPGVWVSSLNYGDMNQQGGELVKVSLTLVVSKVIPLTEAERA